MTKIHKEGYNIIIISFIVLATIDTLAWVSKERILFILMLIITIPLFTLIVRFFRFPKLNIKQDEETIFAPADGQIVTIEEVFEPEYFQEKRLQVSIFMSIFNVHINWVPIPGEIMYYKHHQGRFMSAYLPKSSTDNERATTVIKTKSGTEILVRQIAGAMAKRIVTYPQVGDQVDQTNQLGFIKFGSRVDLFLPIDTEIDVEVCEKVTATQTRIAALKS